MQPLHDVVSNLQYRFLCHRWPATPPNYLSGAAYAKTSKVQQLLAPMLGDVAGRSVLDFGCGYGDEAAEIARMGAARVIGLDIVPEYIEHAARRGHPGCEFRLTPPEEPVDIVVSLDAFEHFSDPAAILRMMYGLLRPGGFAAICFGPTWYHPLGGHALNAFPWVHLLFNDDALIRWRNRSYPGSPRTVEEAGLNRMTVRRFERLVEESEFETEFLTCTPIRKAARLHCRLTREWTTAVVRAKLVKPVRT